ncbi:hypothetical protein OBBRIDRAFT_479262 [Obba rivulosa]|uniref:Uncharacterized protein n=1 Tax=Obba rivulosa TaxID=1052685 RepID=A0A8E2AZL1_9APHY|nr:hypothetical protein OBBRIDRAFT_479262 [Obba rivulosa]
MASTQAIHRHPSAGAGDSLRAHRRPRCGSPRRRRAQAGSARRHWPCAAPDTCLRLSGSVLLVQLLLRACPTAHPSFACSGSASARRTSLRPSQALHATRIGASRITFSRPSVHRSHGPPGPLQNVRDSAICISRRPYSRILLPSLGPGRRSRSASMLRLRLADITSSSGCEAHLHLSPRLLPHLFRAFDLLRRNTPCLYVRGCRSVFCLSIRPGAN